ncbi:MAG: glycosyltransferase [Candidatus Bathyarchaeota archaeon]|nr:glycosyltransferase [Candidatus Bathyarchaeota archaeon]
MKSNSDKHRQSRMKLKILWHSTAPWIACSYGKATKEICTRLQQSGFRLIISAYHGAEPGGIAPYPLPVLPSKAGILGINSAAQYCKQYGIDVGILFSDPWAFRDLPPQLLPKATLYGPMDQLNYSEEVIEFYKKYCKIISLCKWQQKCLTGYGLKSDLIYLGVNVDIFKPMDKKEIRKRMGIDEDVFVFGTVATNNEKDDRKGHTSAIKAMHYFLDQNPDVKNVVWLYHTIPDNPYGLPLSSIAHKFGLDKIIKFMDPSLASTMLSEEELASLMNCFDVHLLCSKREGFGMPILETQACGVPNICHESSSMTELVDGHGWLCKSLGTELNLETTPINAETAVPNVYDIAKCIQDAYFHPNKVKSYGEESIKFVSQYSWDSVVKNQWVPLLDKMAATIKRHRS